MASRSSNSRSVTSWARCDPNWRYPSKQWLEQARRLSRLAPRSARDAPRRGPPGRCRRACRPRRDCLRQGLARDGGAALCRGVRSRRRDLAEDLGGRTPLQRRLLRGAGRLRQGQGPAAARRGGQDQPAPASPRLAWRANWTPGRGSWRAASGAMAPRPDAASSRSSSTGNATPTWPASAKATPWSNSTRPSRPAGEPSGPRLTESSPSRTAASD